MHAKNKKMKLFLNEKIFIRIIINLFRLVVFGLILSGCNNFQTKLETVSEESTLTPLVSEHTPRNTAAELISQIPTFVSPSVEVINPTNTKTIEPVISVTSVPTLTEAEGIKKIQKMLERDGNSQFPCVLDICPYITDRETVESFFRVNGARITISERDFGNGPFRAISYSPAELPVRIIFIEKTGVIDTIDFYIWNDGNYIFDDFKLSNILGVYGPPSRVKIGIYFPVEPPIEDIYFYDFFIFYDQQGIFFPFYGSKVKGEPMLKICPFLDEPIEKSGYSFILGNLRSDYSAHMTNPRIVLTKDIEDVSSMTPEDFYEAYKDENSSECIYADLNKILGIEDE